MLGWSKNCDGQGKIISARATAKEAQTIGALDVSSRLILLKNVIYDDGEFFNGDGKVHIKQDGVYSISGQTYFESQPTQIGSRGVVLSKNSSEQLGNDCSIPSSTSADSCASVSTTARLQKGDYLELLAPIGSRSGDTTAKTVPEGCKIAIARIGD